MTKYDFGPLEAWLSHIRSVRIRFRNQLHQSEEENFNLLCELNVKSQVYDMAKIPCVQKAWVKGQPLRIHGLIYRLEDGILKDLGLTLDRIQQIPEEFWIYSPE
jgi:carbonic anhydrase